MLVPLYPGVLCALGCVYADLRYDLSQTLEKRVDRLEAGELTAILKGQREQGMAPHEAVYQAALVRFRPIMMTTMCALLGAVPLIIITGAGSELRRPLGLAIFGGLLLSQMLTLFTTPVVYLYMHKLQDRIGKTRSPSGLSVPGAIPGAAE